MLIYDNYWFTNFPTNEPGKMNFSFSLTFDSNNNGNDVYESVYTTPSIIYDYTKKQDDLIIKYFYNK